VQLYQASTVQSQSLTSAGNEQEGEWWYITDAMTVTIPEHVVIPHRAAPSSSQHFYASTMQTRSSEEMVVPHRTPTSSSQYPHASTTQSQNKTPSGNEQDDEWRYITDAMMVNIPCRCTLEEVMAAIKEVGFENKYQSFNMPVKKGLGQNMGYAFISFASASMTKQFVNAMTGYHFKARNSQKRIALIPAKNQGGFQYQ